jgi:mannosyltransferase
VRRVMREEPLVASRRPATIAQDSRRPRPRYPVRPVGEAQTAYLPRQDALIPPLPATRESVSETRLLGAVGVAPVEQGSAAESRALTQLAWLLPTLAAGVIGLIRISWPAAWADELATWGMVTTPWGRMFGVLKHTDATLGAYYVFMHLWVSLFHASDFQLRLPSVLAMTGAAGVTARIGTRLGSPRVGLLAGLLFAVFPTTSRYAQEARPYAMVVFAAALSSLALIHALERPRFRPLALYALTISLLGLLHAIALLLILAHGLVVLAVRRQAMLRWLVAAVLGALPALPILYLGTRQTDQVAWITAPSIGNIASYPNVLFGAATIAGMMLILGLFSASTRHPAVLYATWAIVPVIGLIAVSKVTPLWLPRYLQFTTPAWALLAATALGRLRLIRGVAILVLLAAIGLPAQLAARAPDGHLQATREAAAIVATNMRPGDGILYGSHDGGAGVYGTSNRVGRDLIAHYVPAERRPVDVLLVTPQRTGGRVQAVECADITKCLNNRQRVWVIRLGHQNDPLASMGGTKERAVRRLYYASQIWYPHGLTIALLLLKPTS